MFRQGLLFCAVFLWLGEAVLSKRGRCVGDLCVFQVPEDFETAEDACTESGAKLYTLSSGKDAEKLSSVLHGLSGRYWVRITDRTSGEAAKDLRNCPSVSETMGRSVARGFKPCRDKVDGYLCQYGLDDACKGVKIRGSEHVTYTTVTGFELIDTETFPPGTIAVNVGKEYTLSKHLCFSTQWLQAPWKCEVFGGGCEHDCNVTTDTCLCPAGRKLHPNNVTCTAEPCAGCAERRQRTGDTCKEGYRLAEDGKSCLDVNECEEDPCITEGQECMNTPGDFECVCQEGFDEEDGVCVNVTICALCEHMNCQKINGKYKCVCRKGFKVSPIDPTKCDPHCTERDCPASCVSNHELEMKDMHQCHCPDGYIQDISNGTAICTDINECESQEMCDHGCENLFGGYRCLCLDGFKLEGESKCVRLEEEDEDYGSGSASPYLTPPSTPASVQPAAVPSYIKTGSVLGITMFVLLCVLLLYFVVHNMAKRCGRFELSSFKSPDIDIFYLQQVTTETYKRLSFDKQIKNDSQRLESNHT